MRAAVEKWNADNYRIPGHVLCGVMWVTKYVVKNGVNTAVRLAVNWWMKVAFDKARPWVQEYYPFSLFFPDHDVVDNLGGDTNARKHIQLRGP